MRNHCRRAYDEQSNTPHAIDWDSMKVIDRAISQNERRAEPLTNAGTDCKGNTRKDKRQNAIAVSAKEGTQQRSKETRTQTPADSDNTSITQAVNVHLSHDKRKQSQATKLTARPEAFVLVLSLTKRIQSY